MTESLRERQKRRRRREIVEAAFELFRERGYDQARVADIIERLEISEATFFNYFPSKDSVLDEFALVQVELMHQTLAYQLSSVEAPVPDRIRTTMAAAATSITQDPELQATIYTRSRLFHAEGHLKERTLEMYQSLAALFELGQRRGEIRDDVEPLQLGEMLIATYHLTVLDWLVGWWGKDYELEPRLATAVDVLLDGFGPPGTEENGGAKG